jgi:hypothetical protein
MTDVTMTDPEALRGAAYYLEHEYGCYGYRLGIAGAWRDSWDRVWTVFQCRHADGSRFLIRADAYGNTGGFDPSLEVEIAELLGVEITPAAFNHVS